ncbi:pimeloyl-ACP methyl ester carboxylesterase [Okibacterium sp. HSC-33S16]|uniref:alpha/beta fold hydrolase n=1 Tax=Okibacterium sp. HSC-33S16 TaxID=2910965 RepID=UPI00209EB7D5|nr:alpha/beta hydrolase [Okibacterium sp. HSC-33S16]MCP2032377.1 pimeloyl-ACP methyl ester carboxylesterase [Okibacterium sp. HSC-33S16]
MNRKVVLPSGVRIAFTTSGPPVAPAMVVLHGLGEGAASWTTVGHFFADRFRVIALDLRGHGASDWPGAYSFELMRDDVVGVMEALQLRDIVLIGHSMGGTVAYLVASARPDLVARLVIEDAPPPFPRTRAMPERPAEPVNFDWDVVPVIAAAVNDPTRRMWELLPGITAPTLIVGGGASSTVPQELLAEAAGLIPSCRFVEIDAGHNIHESRPSEFATAVLSWLAEPTGPRKAGESTGS